MTSWQSAARQKCPNNARHGELRPHPKGAVYCRECLAAKKPRSREATRWAFGVDALNDKA
jgi:hypothetical protein